MSRAVMVVLNYNDADTVITLVDKIKDYSCLKAVIVVDNCSSDDSFEKLDIHYREYNEKVDVIKTSANKGYAVGNNFGVRFAEAEYDPEYVFVANPDIEVDERTLDKMLDVMDKHNDYGVIAPLVMEGYNVWNLPGYIGMIESMFLIWFNLDKKAIKKQLLKRDDEVVTVGAVEGSFFLIRRKDYDAIDGLDERTFLYVEENILARRLQKISCKVGVCPNLFYHHYHSVSIKKIYHSSKRKAFPNFYKSFRIYNKYYLHTNALQDVFFSMMYALAYLERFLYDCVVNLKVKH